MGNRLNQPGAMVTAAVINPIRIPECSAFVDDVRTGVTARRRKSDPLDKETLLDLFSRLDSYGYLGNVIEIEQGGAGLGYVGFGLLLESLADGLAFLGNHSVQRYLAASAPENPWLPRLLAGTAIGAVAITEPAAGTDVRSLTTTAKREAGRWVLRGKKTWVTHAPVADVIIVLAYIMDGGGKRRDLARFVVPARADGVSVTPFAVSGLAHLTFGHVELTDVSISPEACVDPEGDGFEQILSAFSTARAFVAVQAAAIAAALVRHAKEFVSSRVQFGRPLSTLPMIRAQLAEIDARAEAAQLLAYAALTTLDSKAPDAEARAAQAKFYCTEAAVEIGEATIRLLAGHGLVAGHPVGRLLADARLLQVADGTPNINRMVAGRLLLAD